MKQVNLDSEKLHKATEVIRALAHPLRLEIIQFIDSREYASAKEVYLHFSIDKLDMSQHLRILRLANVITPQQNNNKIVYVINYEKLERIA